MHQKLGQAIKKALDKLAKAIGVYKYQNPDAWYAASKDTIGAEAFRQLQDLYMKAFVQADANYKAAEGQKNTTEDGGTDGEYDIKLSPRMEEAFKPYAKTINSVVNESISGKGNIDGKAQVKDIMPTGPKIIAMVAASSGNAIDLSHRSIALSSSDIWHEYKRHTQDTAEVSRGQIAFTKRQFQNAVKCIISPDMVETIFADTNNPTQKQSFAYAKKTNRGHYVVVEAVGGKKNPHIYPVLIVQFSKAKWNKMMAEGKSLGEMLHEGEPQKLLAQDVEKNKKSRVTAAQFASYEAIANTLRSPQLDTKVSQPEADVNTESAEAMDISLDKKTESAEGMDGASNQDSANIKFDMRDAVEETKDLLAFHNITAKQLADVLKRKGLLMPSLAITNKGMTDFGEISLLFDRNTIDPGKNIENKLYGADAWTPTQTLLKKNAKFNTDQTVRTVNTMKNHIGGKYAFELFNITAKQFKDSIIQAEGSIYDAYAHNIGVQTAYAREKGIIDKIPTNMDGTVNLAALQEQLNKELDTDKGWRQYKKWLNNISDTIITSYDNASNEDILNNMKAQPASAKTFKLTEAGELVVPAVEYSSVGEVRRNKNRLSENAAEATKAVAEELLAFAKRLDGDMKSVVDAINASFVSRYSTADIVKSFAAKDIKISTKNASELQSLYKKAVELPTQYFEAKPGREVGLNEIKAAVIPQNTSAELKQALEAHGVQVVEYDGTRASRVDALNSMDELKFSDRDGVKYDSRNTRKTFKNGQNAKGEFIANVLIDLDDSYSEWWTGRYNRGILGMSQADDTEFRQFYEEILKRTKDMDEYGETEQSAVEDAFVVQDGRGREYIYRVALDGRLHGVVLEKVNKTKYEAALRKETIGGKNGKSASDIKRRTRNARTNMGRHRSGDGRDLAPAGNSGYGRLGSRSPQSDNAGYDHKWKSSDQTVPDVTDGNGQTRNSDRDNDYLDAVNRGDKKAAQKMVDEAAAAAGYKVRAYHGTDADAFSEFDKGRIGNATGVGIFGDGFYFAEQRNIAKKYGKNVYSVFLKQDTPYSAKDTDAYKLKTVDLERQGYDSVVLQAGNGNVYMVLDPNQIKSAEPITYDDNGDVIPLSERFNTEKNDIRYDDRHSEKGFLQQNIEKAKKHNKRSRYSETETLYMIWANGSAPVGERKSFVRFGKIHFYEKTEGGCVEISKSQYNERRGLRVEVSYRRASRKVSNALDRDESSRGGFADNSVGDRDTGTATDLSGQTIGEELRADTARNISSSSRDSDRNELKKVVKLQERSDDSVSNRSLLANALESATQNEIEKSKIQEYKAKIDLINAEEEKLDKLNAQIKELRFVIGKENSCIFLDL